MKFGIEDVVLNPNEKRYHKKRNEFLSVIHKSEESPEVKKFGTFFQNQKKINKFRQNEASKDGDSTFRVKGSNELKHVSKIEIRKNISPRIHPIEKESSNNLGITLMGMALKEPHPNKPMNIKESETISTVSTEKIYTFDNIDDFPSSITSISQIKEDIGPFGLPPEQKERLKNPIEIGLFEHSILKKSYFYFDETIDVEYYKDLSSYSRKVLRNSKYTLIK